MTIDSYDFRKPSRLASDLEQQLVAWLTSGCGLVPEKWAKHLTVPIAHALLGVETARLGDALTQLPDALVAFCVSVGTELVNTLVVLPRPLVLTLVGGMLGDACTEVSGDRSTTPVEESLSEYLFQLLLKAIEEAWPSGEPLAVRLKNLEPVPKRSRLFTPEESLVVCRMAMRGPFGEQQWQWLIPQKALVELLVQTAHVPGIAEEQGMRPRLESLVRDMPVEVSVHLGAAVLHVAQLANLRAGDLVVLDQSVSRPLPAAVAGEKRFHVWPGRVGAKQAFQIESLVES